MFQGLQICRIVKSVGHKIILADMRKFRFSAARFSTSVDEWVSLPDITDNPGSIIQYKVREILERLFLLQQIIWLHAITLQTSLFRANMSELKQTRIISISTILFACNKSNLLFYTGADQELDQDQEC